MIKTVAVLTSIVFMAACATPPPPVVKPIDPIRAAIALTLAKSSDISRHTMSADSVAAPAKVDGERITIRSYVGDASNLLSRIAKARGMNFKVNGPEPRLPLLVTVDVESVTFEDFLTQVGFQFGQRADLVLGESRIEIRYRGQP